MTDLIKLKDVRISFPNLFEKIGFEGSEPKYGAHFIIEKGSEADKQILAAIEKAAKGKWGAKAEKTLSAIRGNNMKYVYQDGAQKDYGENTMYISTKSLKQPAVYHAVVNGKAKPATKQDNPVYSGCYVNALITVYPTSSGGIAAGLSGVMFVRDGEAFGGGYVASAADFDATEDSDPLA